MLTRTIATFFALMLASPMTMASDIMVMNARAPASLTPVTRTAAIYLELMNHGTQPDTLLGVSSPAADHAQAHETLHENGVVKMRPLERLSIAPSETLALEPGGRHIMLTGLRAPLKEGETLPLVLTFEKAGEVSVTVPVVDKLDAVENQEHEHAKED